MPLIYKIIGSPVSGFSVEMVNASISFKVNSSSGNNSYCAPLISKIEAVESFGTQSVGRSSLSVLFTKIVWSVRMTWAILSTPLPLQISIPTKPLPERSIVPSNYTLAQLIKSDQFKPDNARLRMVGSI